MAERVEESGDYWTEVAEVARGMHSSLWLVVTKLGRKRRKRRKWRKRKKKRSDKTVLVTKMGPRTARLPSLISNSCLLHRHWYSSFNLVLRLVCFCCKRKSRCSVGFVRLASMGYCWTRTQKQQGRDMILYFVNGAHWFIRYSRIIQARLKWERVPEGKTGSSCLVHLYIFSLAFWFYVNWRQNPGQIKTIYCFFLSFIIVVCCLITDTGQKVRRHLA